jgi:3-methylfumaryl-CoA hydratase
MESAMDEAWQPVVEQAVDTVPASRAAALHDLLDAPGDPPGAGDPVPPLWHWISFLPRSAQRDLGEDGHQKLGGFLPQVDLPRRMFAGGRVEFLDSAPLDAPLSRRSVVTSVTEKSGRTGDLVFVEVMHELTRGDRAVLTEQQDLVYRSAPDAGTPRSPERSGSANDDAGPTGAKDWPWRIDLPTDPRMLFRFSALTYNAHRIHYDHRYATQVEGYPDLVVHGPLQAVALAELCRRFAPDRAVASFLFRARRPVFSGGPIHVRGRPVDGSKAELVVVDSSGQASMTATVEFAPARVGRTAGPTGPDDHESTEDRTRT